MLSSHLISGPPGEWGFNLARLVGPMIAGVLIAMYGVGAAFVFNAVSFLAFVISLVMLRIEPLKRRSGKTGRSRITSALRPNEAMK